ncbi:hypothetical protein BJY01DRAFT_216743 [Aspergillus pseudoustus]|uniref:Secreted protein n=1 Tax=Aspergillus pseudoustus TaxID=1810923 RepID=A0ABR4JQA8_9EURO
MPVFLTPAWACARFHGGRSTVRFLPRRPVPSRRSRAKVRNGRRSQSTCLFCCAFLSAGSETECSLKGCPCM